MCVVMLGIPSSLSGFVSFTYSYIKVACLTEYCLKVGLWGRHSAVEFVLITGSEIRLKSVKWLPVSQYRLLHQKSHKVGLMQCSWDHPAQGKARKLVPCPTWLVP